MNIYFAITKARKVCEHTKQFVINISLIFFWQKVQNRSNQKYNSTINAQETLRQKIISLIFSPQKS